MERRGFLKRILASVSNNPENATNKLQGMMEAYNVQNSKKLPLAIRSQLAREIYQNYKDKTGEPYQGGDTPTFGLWFGTLEKLGPDAVAKCIREGLISPRFFKNQDVESQIEDLEDLAERQGWGSI